MQRKPGETIQELAARIRHDAVRCDFPSIKDPQDEAMRTRFMCSVNNEVVLKALFKVKDDELTFAKALQIAQETEEAAKVAKETVYGAKPIQQSPSPYSSRSIKFSHHSSSLRRGIPIPNQQLVALTREIYPGEPVQGAARWIMDLRTALSKRLYATTARRWGIFKQPV